MITRFKKIWLWLQCNRLKIIIDDYDYNRPQPCQAVTHPIMNRARRCLTSVIELTPMRQRRIPYTWYNIIKILLWYAISNVHYHTENRWRPPDDDMHVFVSSIMWNSMTLTSFVFTELANTMKYGEGVLYNLVFTEWRHCVSQNEVWGRGCYITLFSPSDVNAFHRIRVSGRVTANTCAHSGRRHMSEDRGALAFKQIRF